MKHITKKVVARHRGKTPTEKAAREKLLVLFLDIMTPTSVGSLETETRTDIPPAPNLSPLKGIKAYKAHAKDIHHTHVACFTFKELLSEAETLPLPDIQPTCPPHWDAEAWDKRMVWGTMDYHVFCSGKNIDKRFILKVSDVTDHSGKWVYEDIDPATMNVIVALALVNCAILECRK